MQMRDEVKRIQRELGITIVFVTHQEEAMELSHRIVVMNKGYCEQIGTPAEIYNRPATRFIANFIGEMNFILQADGSEIAVRPENIELASAASGEALLLGGEGRDNARLLDEPARIESITILGHYSQIYLDYRGQRLKAYATRDVATPFQEGDLVRVALHGIRHYEAAA